MTKTSLQLIPPIDGQDIALVPVKRPVASKHAPSVYLAALAPSSRRAQRSALERIALHLSDNDADFWTLPWPRLRHEHVAAIRARLVDEYAPETAKRMIAALRGTLKAAWRLGQMDGETLARAIDVAPIRAQSLPRGRALSNGEVRALFDACARDSNITGVRDAALLAVLLGAGLRRFEIVALDVDDYNPSDGSLSIRRGKGAKGRVCYLGASGRDALEYWLEWRGKRPGALFHPLSRGGRVLRRRINVQTVTDVGHRRAKHAGVRAFSPHDARRTFISNLLDANVDISTVQKLAGHASPATTSKYDRRGEAVKRRAAEEIHLPFVRPLSSTNIN